MGFLYLVCKKVISFLTILRQLCCDLCLFCLSILTSSEVVIIFVFRMAPFHLLVVREKWLFAYTKTKMQISCALLTSPFVFAAQKEQSCFFLNPKFQVSNHLLWPHEPVCTKPGHKNPKDLDPVVQSIVSLTISLRHKFVKQISAKVTNTLLFFVEKM